VALKVGPMCVADLEEVIAIEKLSFAMPWSRNSFLNELMENERAVYLVVKNEFEQVIGYIGMWIIFDEGHITNFACKAQVVCC
jgi:ribosomal-protein-alanine N-acetyltransferase